MVLHAMLAAITAAAAAGSSSASLLTTISNGAVSVSLGPAGMVAINEKDEGAAGHPALKLILSTDDWEVTISNGTAPDARMPWTARGYAVTTAAAAALTLSSKSCTSAPARAASSSTSATIGWTCPGGFTVEAVYSLEPAGAHVTKTMRVAGAGSFSVAAVAPWTGLSISAAGAAQPAEWSEFKNGFSGQLSVAGFGRWAELNRGFFVTVQVSDAAAGAVASCRSAC